jgi:hypothetical protein
LITEEDKEISFTQQFISTIDYAETALCRARIALQRIDTSEKEEEGSSNEEEDDDCTTTMVPFTHIDCI